MTRGLTARQRPCSPACWPRWVVTTTFGLLLACGAPQQSVTVAPTGAGDAPNAQPAPAAVNPALSRLPSRLRAALEDHRWTDAARLLAQEQLAHPTAADIRALQAVVALQSQEVGQAIAYAESAWEALRENQPCAFSACDTRAVTLLLANVLGRAGLPGRTIELLETVAEDASGDVALLRANAAMALAQHDDAAQALHAAQRANRALEDAGLAAIVADRQNDPNTTALYAQALQAAPHLAAVWIHAGFHALATQDTALARQRLQHALSLLPTTDPTHHELRAVLESLAP